MIVAIKEQENSLKRCAKVALNNRNKQIAKCVEWNVLTTKRFVICAVFTILSIQIILTKMKNQSLLTYWIKFQNGLWRKRRMTTKLN